MDATRVSETYHIGHPLGGRFGCIRGRLKLVRESLDALRDDEVRWTPYAGSRQHHPLSQRALYSGCIRHYDRVYRYLPERVLRQFGYVQTVPRDPPRLSPVDQVDDAWLHWEAHILDLMTLVLADGQCAPDYMEWFLRVSHPYLSHDVYEMRVQQQHAEAAPTHDEDHPASPPQTQAPPAPASPPQTQAPPAPQAQDYDVVGPWALALDIVDQAFLEVGERDPAYAYLLRIRDLARLHGTRVQTYSRRRVRRRTDDGAAH